MIMGSTFFYGINIPNTTMCTQTTRSERVDCEILAQTIGNLPEPRPYNNNNNHQPASGGENCPTTAEIGYDN
jgi:hypothetical protein